VQNEAKVGAFFLAAVVLISAVLLFLGDYAGRWSSLIVTAHFQDVAGLEPGAEVRLSGVRVGRVLRILLQEHPQFPGRPAQVIMAIQRDVMLFEGDQFFVDQGALIGDKYVTVVRTDEREKRRLAGGQHVAGAGLAGLSGLAQEAQDLIADAKRTLRRIEDTLGGPERREQIDQIVSNVISLTARADQVSVEALKFAQDLARMSAQTRPQVAAMAENLAQSARAVRTTVQMVQRILATSPVPANMAQASENIAQSTDDIRRVTENLSATLADPATRARLDQLITNLDAATGNLAELTAQAHQLISDDRGIGQDLKATMANLQRATDDLARTSAHVREVITDPKMTEDVKVSVAKTRETLEETAKVGEKASKSLDRVDGTMDRIRDALASVRPSRTQSTLAVEAAADRGMRADLNADLYYQGSLGEFWRVGIYDIGDSERLNLQRSVPLSETEALRLGIHANKAGVGYDRLISDRLRSELDLWDPKAHRFDLRFGYLTRPGLDLTFGADDMLHDADPFIGLRYNFGGTAADKGQ